MRLFKVLPLRTPTEAARLIAGRVALRQSCSGGDDRYE